MKLGLKSKISVVRIFGVLLAFNVACTSVIARAAEDVVKAADAGFQLTMPDTGWGYRVQPGDGDLSAIFVEPAESGGHIQLSIRASEIIDVNTESVQSDIKRIRKFIETNPRFSEIEDLQLDVGGQHASGIRLIQKAFDQEFRVHLVFFHSRGIRYRIQFHAPRDTFDKNWKTAQQVLAGFELIDLDETAHEQSRLRQLAGRCGSQINWSANWEEAAKRARQEQRLIVVSVYAQPGFAIGNQLNESVFMSPEIISLVDHRFVAVRWNRGQPAPFVSHEVFGLSASTFGAGLLVCTPDGQVVRQIFFLQPVLVADGLRGALQEHPESAPPPKAPTTQRAEAVAFLIDSGQLEAARELIGEQIDDESGAIAFQRTRLHRIKREGNEAIQALQTAKQRSTPALHARLLLEEATIRIGLGQNDAAENALRRCMNDSPNDTERAEAMFLLGALSWAAGDVQRASEQWTALTHKLPEQPYAWAGAAALLGPALAMDIKPDLSWPSEAAERIATIPATAPKSSTFDITPVIVEAADWLIEAQRPDGEWDTRFTVGDTHPAPSPIAMAVQAIDTLALFRAAHHWQDDEPERAARCLDAARLGLNRYCDDRKLERQYPRLIAFMDYTCWGSSYGLFCLMRVLDNEFDAAGATHGIERGELESEVAYLIKDLVRIQAGNGGWSYYVSGKVDGTAVGAAMSFTTATVLLALQSAKDAGFEVPAESLSRGYACLASMRGTNGAWVYMRRGDEPFTAGVVDPRGAAARGPICTLAMRRADLLNTEAMKLTFQLYNEHLDGFTAEARKALMHAGAATQGSHYLLYDYSTAAEALRATGDEALDPITRNNVRAAILRGLARCRNADGSFVDNPIIGCAAGTGLAIFTLLDLKQDHHAAGKKND